MAKTIKLNEETKGKVGSKKEQENLASEIDNKNPRKMSEIIADKKAALAKNEELLRALQTNEYDIPVGSAKLYKQIMKFLEKEADWGHTTATGLIMLYSNLKEQQPIVREKDWNGIIKLRGTSISIFWTMITSMKGKGFFTARDFVEMMAAFGQDLSKVVGKVHEDNQALRENHTNMSELDKEVNNPDVILDVAISDYHEAEEELNNLMDEVDPVVEKV
jgi:hypothetical protein|tara:strand:+ start:6140 stop:6796 length:657 start_codon:yes stop_codon:yes gene_type:complete